LQIFHLPTWRCIKQDRIFFSKILIFFFFFDFFSKKKFFNTDYPSGWEIIKMKNIFSKSLQIFKLTVGKLKFFWILEKYFGKKFFVWWDLRFATKIGYKSRLPWVRNIRYREGVRHFHLDSKSSIFVVWF